MVVEVTHLMAVVTIKAVLTRVREHPVQNLGQNARR